MTHKSNLRSQLESDLRSEQLEFGYVMRIMPNFSHEAQIFC